MSVGMLYHLKCCECGKTLRYGTSSNFKNDFVMADSLDELQQIAEEQEWLVTPGCGTALCPDCKPDTGNRERNIIQ